MEFEWDDDKNNKNAEKHGIDFETAAMIFAGERWEYISARHEEQRTVAIGILENRHIAVIYTMRSETIRIISARRARKKEVQSYEQFKKDNT